ncbi:uncharacterized protein E0L32_005344 [Thyridium curvatum]|uniref:Uncharacterized protein n=1 Tax=Thyridium curvatum TaxID=1093900 RepID=A0A507AXG5_9PEZI|nr:uncharacterized protein E0L32_005344 [Thyridium curvatum]TPX14652.1 hypothetical protein E0L32_005344 [Thyridium curvatum]
MDSNTFYEDDSHFLVETVAQKIMDPQPHSRGQKQGHCNTETGNAILTPPHNSNLEERNDRSTVAPSEPSARVELMPINRTRNIPFNTMDGKTNHYMHGVAATTVGDNTPLGRWLGQSITDEPYHNIGFVQVNQEADQHYTTIDPTTQASLDANVSSAKDEPHMDGENSKKS